MPELLRTFRLGAINLFGVTIPGFILLLISVIGFLLPTLFLVLAHYIQLSTIKDECHEYKWIIVVVILLLAYVSGYILRLTSPNELDKVSAEKMESNSEGSEVWNYDNKADHQKDKFPYSRLKTYFEKHGHKELADLVEWDPSKPSSMQKCTNTTINRLKLDIALDCPELATVVDS